MFALKQIDRAHYTLCCKLWVLQMCCLSPGRQSSDDGEWTEHSLEAWPAAPHTWTAGGSAEGDYLIHIPLHSIPDQLCSLERISSGCVALLLTAPRLLPCALFNLLENNMSNMTITCLALILLIKAGEGGSWRSRTWVWVHSGVHSSASERKKTMIGLFKLTIEPVIIEHLLFTSLRSFACWVHMCDYSGEEILFFLPFFLMFALNIFDLVTGKKVCHGAEHQECAGQAEPRSAAAAAAN